MFSYDYFICTEREGVGVPRLLSRFDTHPRWTPLVLTILRQNRGLWRVFRPTSLSATRIYGFEIWLVHGVVIRYSNFLCFGIKAFRALTLISFLAAECVALYDYTGEAGDLSFTAGDVIKVHKDEGEWWEGSCNGEEGLFPANYVKKKDVEVTFVSLFNPCHFQACWNSNSWKGKA